MNRKTKNGIFDLIMREKHKTGNIIHQNCLTIASFYLVDKLDFTSEDVDKFIAYFNDTLDSIHKGYINVHELREQLKEEFGIEYKTVDIKEYSK